MVVSSIGSTSNSKIRHHKIFLLEQETTASSAELPVGILLEELITILLQIRASSITQTITAVGAHFLLIRLLTSISILFQRGLHGLNPLHFRIFR